ncbi:MAG: hypothetical protein K6A90_05270 [Lachnospiraceae bacterium]|nr:hypothetical protein [Lachnospiraceae bacterium]
MKKAARKALAIGLTVLLGLSILTGCGAKKESSAPAPEAQTKTAEPEKKAEEKVEEVEEDEEFEEDFEEIEEDFEEDFDEEAEAPEEEPAEGLSDQVLMNGYYGFWDGETEYMFGVLSDTAFMINVVGASSPILYADGEYKDNGDGTYTATIVTTDNLFAEGQTLLIKAEGGPDIYITSDNPEVNEAAEGLYTYAGEKASDINSLK